MKSPHKDTLAELAKIAREEDRSVLADPHWERLASGDLPAVEAQMLEQRAAREGFAAATELHAPLGAALRERLFASAAAGMAGSLDADRKSAAEGPPSAASAADAAPSPAHEMPANTARAGSTPTIKPKQHARWATAVGALALAASIALFLLLRSSPPKQELADLPGYDLQISGGVAHLRGDPAEKLVFQQGSPLTLYLRPATGVGGQVEARAFLRKNGRSQELSLKTQQTPEGAIRLSGELQISGLDPGPAQVIVYVGRPGATRDLRDERGVVVLHQEIILRGVQ